MSGVEHANHEQRFHELLVKAVDDALNAQEQREFEQLIVQNPEFQQEVREHKKLREVIKMMKVKEPPREVWDSYWQGVYNRIERGIGWILLSIGSMILLTYGGYKMVESLIADPNLAGILKAAILLVIAGTVVLLVSVVREKLFMRKSDPYKEVQR